jgi:hypothetical protein
MTEPTADRRIDRILFSYGAHDIGFTGSSLSEEDERRYAWLVKHVRVSHYERPAASLWYWSEDGTAFLLRRVGVDDDHHADWCQGLVGPAHLLTARGALGLKSWAGWADAGWAGRRLEPDGEDLIYCDFGAAAAALGAAAGQQRTQLVALVAAILRHPWRPFTVRAGGLPLDLETALLWGLLECAGPLLDAPADPPLPAWTFSTFEARVDAVASRRPRVAFLAPPSEGTRAGDMGLSLVNLADDPATAVATSLVTDYLQGGANAVVDWLTGLGVWAQARAEGRLAVLLGDAAPAPPRRPALPPGVRQLPLPPAPRLAPGAAQGTAPATAPPPAPAPDPGLAAAPAAAAVPAPTPDPVPAPAPEHAAAGAPLDAASPAPAGLAGLTGLELARRLVSGRGHEPVVAVLGAIRGQCATSDRPQVLELLLAHDFGVRVLRAEFSPSIVRRSLRLVLRFGLQPEDFEQPATVLRLNAWMGRPDADPLAVRFLVDYTADHDLADHLAPGAGARYFHAAGIDSGRGRAPSAPRPPQGLREWLHWFGHQPRAAQVAMSSLVLLVMLQFTLGIWLAVR